MKNNWDKRWMDLAMLVATWSKDRSTKVAAVIVDNREILISIGWNGFPRLINDNINERHERPQKYQWTEHVERNAIYNAAAKGVSTLNCRMYIAWYPCADCARAIIQSGISKLITVEPEWDNKKWASDFFITKEMLFEVNIEVKFYT